MSISQVNFTTEKGEDVEWLTIDETKQTASKDQTLKLSDKTANPVDFMQRAYNDFMSQFSGWKLSKNERTFGLGWIQITYK